MITEDEWRLLRFTVGAGLASTLLILPPGLFLAWLLARKSFHGKTVLETAICLPLVMPPVAVGLILLRLFGRRGPIGGLLHDTFGWDVAFAPPAVVLALAVMSFPLLVRTARVAFEEVNPRLEHVARTLGAGPQRVFWRITAPLAARGVVAGTVLAFARALGEFGATILVAGNIPGRTQTLPVAIYHSIQLGQDAQARRLMFISIALSFGALAVSEWFARTSRRRP